MSIRDRKAINILNHNDNMVVISTKNDSYLMQPCDNDEPSILPLTFDEISYINSNSNVFKTGILRFQEDLEEEIYEELKIVNWKSLLTNKDIANIILNPTIDGLNKIISMDTVANFERVKGIFTTLKNANKHDISMRVEDIILARDSELRKGIRKSEIIIKPSDTEKRVALDEVNELKAQLQAMQEMMKQMMNNQTNNNLSEENNGKKDVTTETKKAGRPPSKK